VVVAARGIDGNGDRSGVKTAEKGRDEF